MNLDNHMPKTTHENPNLPSARPPGSEASKEYRAGVEAACKWLEGQTLTEEEQHDDVSWAPDCPQTFAYLIRGNLLSPNSELSSERAAEQQKQKEADARRLLK